MYFQNPFLKRLYLLPQEQFTHRQQSLRQLPPVKLSKGLIINQVEFKAWQQTALADGKGLRTRKRICIHFWIE